MMNFLIKQTEEELNIQSNAQTDETQEEAALLAALLIAGSISVEEWEARLQTIIRDEYSEQYNIGNETTELSATDIAIITPLILAQYDFLVNFTNDVDSMSERAIIARQNQYINSARQAYEQGKLTRLQNLPIRVNFPAYPGDLSTICGSNCRCWWEHSFDDKDRWVGGIWRLDDRAKHCPQCPNRASTWNPLILVQYNKEGRPFIV